METNPLTAEQIEHALTTYEAVLAKGGSRCTVPSTFLVAVCRLALAGLQPKQRENSAEQEAAHVERIVRFAGMVLDTYRESWGSDLDGYDVQEMMRVCGLTDQIIVTEVNICADGCDCEVGDTCNRYNAAAHLAMRALERLSGTEGEKDD
jgi:hypothetical protein